MARVEILRVSREYTRTRPGKGPTKAYAYVSGLVDGYKVTCAAHKEWTCECGDEACSHPDALAAVLHSSVLAQLGDLELEGVS